MESIHCVGVMPTLYRHFDLVPKPVTRGFHADVYRSNDGLTAVKVVGLHPDDRMDERQVWELGRQVVKFHEWCQAFGIRVPESLECGTGRDVEMGWNIMIEREAWAGIPFQDWLKTNPSPERIRRVLERMISQIMIVFLNADAEGFSRIGIDTKPTNFTVDDNDQVTYVDMVPPRYRLADGGFLITFQRPIDDQSREFFIKRYFTKLGLIKVFLVQLARIDLSLRGVALEILRDMGNGKLSAQLANLPSTRYLGGEGENLIRSLAGDDPDGIRDLACAMAIGKNGHTQERLDQIFYLTHLDVRQPPQIAPDRLECIRSILHDLLGD